MKKLRGDVGGRPFQSGHRMRFHVALDPGCETGDHNGCNGPVFMVEDGGSHGIDAHGNFLPTKGDSLSSYSSQLMPKGFWVGHRMRGQRFHFLIQKSIDHHRVRKSEDRFPSRGGVDGNSVSDIQGHTQGAFSLGDVSHDRMFTGHRFKHNGFPHLLTEIHKKRHGQIQRIAADGAKNGLPEFQGRGPQNEFPRSRVVLEEPFLAEDLEDAAHRRRMKAQRLTQIHRPHLMVVMTVKCHQDGQGFFDGSCFWSLVEHS